MAQMITQTKKATAQLECSAPSRREPTGVRRGAALLALLLAAPLGACGVNRTLPPPDVAYDFRDRHPVALADVDHTIDVFPSGKGPRLDTATSTRISEFVNRYQRLGHGQITLLAPTGGAAGVVSRVGVDQVRQALAAAGVTGGIYVGTYPVADPTLAAPIRLSFRGVKAKVQGRCGEWPEDLASGSSLEGWQNQTYWNFGCANQATLSAQVEDPRDLATPRGQTAGDIEMRMRAIGQVRKGEDPTTKWDTKGANISTVGGGT